MSNTLASGHTPDAEFHLVPPSKEFADVFAFHEKFGQIRHTVPGHLSAAKVGERVDFMQEELDEFREGVAENDLAKQADALVDLVYVAMGTAVMLGLPWDWLWNDVQRANMAKVPGMTHRGTQMDVTKPPGWQPPQTQRILDIAGYRRDEWFQDVCHQEVPVIGGSHQPVVSTFIKEKARDDVNRSE